ncbi:MAG: hypothetical protein O9346_16310 [Leptospiraceae bacterium]|jgi:hypothetical protein|nr:hypothetical protein [Leptospiraceae bacterium]MCZ8347977.1 hypothetical protein [Leptospiraceae bacterium]
MDKSKITPELLTKILREHSEMLSVLKLANGNMSSIEWKEWIDKKTEIISKIQKIESP